MKSWCLAGGLAVASWTGAAGVLPAQPGGPLPQPLPLFPADNWWNVDVRSAPVDPSSADLIDFIGRHDGLHPDFGGDAGSGPEIYGMVYVSVPGDQALQPVTFVEYGDESDDGALGRPKGYPIPPEAKTEARWIEGGYPGNVRVDGDRHMLIVDRDHRILFELYHTYWNAGRSRWEAGSGAVFDLDENGRRPEGWTSADAAGLAILPGLVRYDEAFGSEPIRHAFRVTVHATDGHVYPASHTAGSTPGGPPMGARLRLKAGKDLSGYPAAVRRIFQAMKTYGLIVADNGTDMYVTGAYDTRWDNDVLNPAFESLEAGDFEVLELGWQPDTTPPPPPPPPPSRPCAASATRLCLDGDRFAVDVHWTAPNGKTGSGHAENLTADTGYFWFFNSENVEMVLKVLDGCEYNDHFWVFAGGLTNVEVAIQVTDTSTDTTKSYRNRQGRPFQPIQDSAAFATCP